MGNRWSRKDAWTFEEHDLVDDLTSIRSTTTGTQLWGSQTWGPKLPAVVIHEEAREYKVGGPVNCREKDCHEQDRDKTPGTAEVKVEAERRSASEGTSTSGRADSFAMAASILLRGQYVVAFTGAGISVDSGIPDFRSPSGLWARFDPTVYCSYPAFLQRPELFWTMVLEMQRLTGHAEPNGGHAALVELEKLAGVRCVITQNVDALHQRAGSSIVHELHGSVCTMTCVACKKKRSVWPEMTRLRQLDKKQLASSDVPKCPRCGSAMKMDVVLFGEALQYSVLQEAMRAATQADVILVVGTSLTVAPANGLVQQCKARGGQVIVCNLDDSGQEFADVVLRGGASDTLARLVSACKKRLVETRSQLEDSFTQDQQGSVCTQRTLASVGAQSDGGL